MNYGPFKDQKKGKRKKGSNQYTQMKIPHGNRKQYAPITNYIWRGLHGPNKNKPPQKNVMVVTEVF